ncbi:MAG: AEC family transporter [Chitinophagales bacterium]
MPLYFLFVLFIVGILAQQISVVPKQLYRYINKFILYVPLPAIVVSRIPFLEINHEVLFPIASAWIIFFGSMLYAYIICKLFNYDKKTMACMILCCGLGNTSFVGYPFLQHFYGKESLRYAIFVDQPGSFLILSTLGVFVAAYFSTGKFDLKKIVLKLIQFPPFIVFIISLFIPKELISKGTADVLETIGNTMVPLAMLSLGLQFKLDLKEIEWTKFFAGTFYKLILAPFIIYVLFYFVLKQQNELSMISVLECAMPPMITSSILAVEYDLDAKLANTYPTLGILFSVITLLVWKMIL